MGAGRNAFEFRGLEFHSSRMWQWAQVDRALALMRELGLNALIFHQNDLTDQLVLPGKWFPEELMWKINPVRMHTIGNNRHYVNRVVAAAKELGIDFYVEVKELWFPDALPDVVPGLRNSDGSLCPHNPFFREFLHEKYRELVDAVPGLAGVIVSAGTRESKVSISANRCGCERCRTNTPLDWYTGLLQSIYDPLSERGKLLAVRDFAYTAEVQSTMITAADRVSQEIVVTLKNAPHDYYPNFPDNPKIGSCGAHRQWVEFDGWGQFYGLGFFPVSVVEDMQKRMRRCRDLHVDGVWVRTDWEVITDGGAFNSFNLVNVFGAALFSADPETDADEVYRRWLSYGLLSPLKPASALEAASPPLPAAFQQIVSMMKTSWTVMEKATYVRGHVFNEDDQFPNSVERAFDMMVRIHGRDEWEPGASSRLEPTPENLDAIFAEKREAVILVRKIAASFDSAALGVNPGLASEIDTVLDLYTWYVRGFEVCARLCFLAKRAESTAAGSDAAELERAAAELRDFRDGMMARMANTHYPHYVYWLLDEKRLWELAADGERRLANMRGGARS
ncbi:MAG TPA: hypothetical protein VMW87_13710 [Spirochaetia bacterium]|nr:hypothetical protein [Spirochaetia bacterium]